MIVSGLFRGQVVGTAASFYFMTKSSFYYSDATFSVMQYNNGSRQWYVTRGMDSKV